MASCPTETEFEGLTALYQDGLEAVLSDDLDRLHSILNDADEAIARLPEGPISESASVAQQATAAAWRRLQGAVQSSRDETQAELAKTRSGKRAARAYGSDKRAPGMRHSSQV